MYISRARIWNYKSFFGAGELVFGPGFNVITGQNNSGKTALLEALSLQFAWIPHRSIATVPVEGGVPPQVCEIEVSITISADEFRELLASAPAVGSMFLALPDFASEFARSNGIPDAGALANWFVRLPSYTFNLRLRNSGNQFVWTAGTVPTFGYYASPGSNGASANFMHFEMTQPGDRIRIAETSMRADSSSDVGVQIAGKFSRFVYLFRAERFNTARRAFGGSDVLLPDASNLPEVLNRLQGNRERFGRFIDLVKTVLSQVKDVTVLPAQSGQNVEIRVWTDNVNRVDLTRPLDHCGTGIGQVLAILYVAVNSTHPGVILIDEPQSFLHPGAVRKLVEILAEYPQHQYICSTHSSSVISSAEPVTITIARLEDDQTKVLQVRTGEPDSLRTCLAEVGARLSDVFGADQILWVEGRTEETCFPLLLRELAAKKLMGTIILGLRNTGELEGGDAERVVEIYHRLSKAGSLMPPSVGFVLDQEGRSELERTDISRRTGESVRFLPRRMFENYLLHADAISSVLTTLDAEHGQGHSVEQVHAALEIERVKPENYRPLDVPAATEGWRNTIHGAKVLKAIFGTLSEHRIRYDKVGHGEALIRDIIANRPDQLASLSRFLLEILPNE